MVKLIDYAQCTFVTVYRPSSECAHFYSPEWNLITTHILNRDH